MMKLADILGHLNKMTQRGLSIITHRYLPFQRSQTKLSCHNKFITYPYLRFNLKGRK